MKTIIKMNLIGVVILLLGLSNYSFAQSTTWQFSSGDGKGGGVKIIEKNEVVSEVYLRLKDGAWGKAIINAIDDYEDTYLRITYKSTVSEMFVYWNDDKLLQIRADGTERIYWLKK